MLAFTMLGKKLRAVLGSAAQRMQVAKLLNCVLCTRVELVPGEP